jgi:hypothetical protein
VTLLGWRGLLACSLEYRQRQGRAKTLCANVIEKLNAVMGGVAKFELAIPSTLEAGLSVANRAADKSSSHALVQKSASEQL